MSSPTLLARPSLATLSISVATMAWSGLAVATGMMLADEGRFAGNPLYTLAVAIAITATVVGIQLRCHTGQVVESVVRQYIQTAATIEIPRATRYVSGPVSVMGSELVRPSAPTADLADVLPSPGTVAAMRRLAAKVTRAE